MAHCRRGNDATDFLQEQIADEAILQWRFVFLHATRLQVEQQTPKASCRRSNFASVFYFLTKMDRRQSNSISDAFHFHFWIQEEQPSHLFCLQEWQANHKNGYGDEEIFVLGSNERGKIFCGSGFEKTHNTWHNHFD